jgi:hypothetical protein
VMLTGFVHGGSSKAATVTVCPGSATAAASVAHAPRTGQSTADNASCS